MKQFYLLLSILTIIPISIFASKSDTIMSNKPKHPFAYSGYQGGMMFNIGYVQSHNFQFLNQNQQPLGAIQQLKGASLGIGGALRVGFGKYLRVGIEGYVSTHKYGPNASSAKVGWGGLLLDSHWHIKRWTIFTGGVIGGGSYTHTTLINADNSIANYPNDFVVENQHVSYRHYPFLVLNPFVGCEYSLTKRISAVAKIDYMLNATNWADDFATGPRFFIGFMFGR